MAHALTQRMSRLMINSRQFISKAKYSPASSKQSIATSPKCNIIANHHQGTAMMRCLSSVMPSLRKLEASPTAADYGATEALPTMPSQSQAENFAAFVHANRHQKVKPFIIKRRRDLLRTYIGNKKNIRHSPWRMNLVCQFAAGLTVPEALKQLMFCQKRMAPLVSEVIRQTATEADEEDGLQPSQLEVAECFATHGHHLKRIKIMGRGRHGIKHHKHSHIRLVLREIDFPTKILQAESINQKRKWLGTLRQAREDYEKASIEQEELAELEAMAAQIEEEARKKKQEEEDKKN